MPRFFEPGAWGAVVGAVASVVIGFTWGGWVTQTTASRMARDGADAAVVQALVPICVAQSQQDPNSKQKYEQLGAASSWSRDDLLAKTGWATMPGTDAPNRGVVTACPKTLAIPS